MEIKLPCDNWFIVEQNHRRSCRSHSLLCDVAPQTWHWNLLNWQRGRPPMANPLFLRENWRFVPKFLFKSGISYCIVEILKTALCSNSMGYMHSVLANQVADIFTPNDNIISPKKGPIPQYHHPLGRELMTVLKPMQCSFLVFMAVLVFVLRYFPAWCSTCKQGPNSIDQWSKETVEWNTRGNGRAKFSNVVECAWCCEKMFLWLFWR